MMSKTLKTEDHKSVIQADTVEVRGKMIDSDELETVFVHLRIKNDWLHTHLLIDGEGSLVAMTSGKTDSDAWTRLQADIRRRFDLTL